MTAHAGVTVPASLVMTVLNEAGSLPAFLERIPEQTVLPEELVVVDGGSSDGTRDVLCAWSPPAGMRLTVVSAPGANISQGRNIAIATASNEAILVTDGGIVLADRWVEEMWQALADGADVAAGFFEPYGEGTFQAALAQIITPRLSEIRPDAFLPSSRSVGFWRHWWREAGGYPEWLDYCEDLVFDLELKRLGAKFVFVPAAVVVWNARPDLVSFAKQYYRYARGDGKAGLWPKRHAMRYAAYVVGVGLVFLAAPVGIGLVLVGAAGYMRKSVLRLAPMQRWRGLRRVKAIAMLPAIVITGDVAKMVGYPVGLMWRLERGRRDG